MFKFQVITFPKFSEEELNKITLGLFKNFKFKGDKKIFGRSQKMGNSEDIKDDI